MFRTWKIRTPPISRTVYEPKTKKLVLKRIKAYLIHVLVLVVQAVSTRLPCIQGTFVTESMLNICHLNYIYAEFVDHKNTPNVIRFNVI